MKENPSPKFEDVTMPSGKQFLVVQGDSYLRYNEVTRKHEIVVQETIFRYENNGETFKDCYSNEIVLDYDASDKLIFEYRLKGRIEPDFPGRPE